MQSRFHRALVLWQLWFLFCFVTIYLVIIYFRDSQRICLCKYSNQRAMEPLDDPRKLSFKFEVTPQSPLENLLDIGHSRSQRRTSSTQPSQSSSAALSTLDGISEKFRDTLRSFSEHGNSTDFLKTVNEIIELSHAFLPEKRSFVKALDASLDEFLAPEENGGLPEENIRDVLRHIKHALDESMQIQIDRKVLQELALALREMPSAKPLRRTDNDEGRPARRALDSDEEEEEEEAVEGAGGDEDDLEEETVTVDSDRMKIFKNPQFLETAKANIGLGMSAEKDVISATLKKVLDKVRDKRGERHGYHSFFWTLEQLWLKYHVRFMQWCLKLRNSYSEHL